MVEGIYKCMGFVAPYYNLILVAIVIALFIKLFRTPSKKIYIPPWKYLFAAIIVFVIEEIITVLEALSLIVVNPIIFPIFETLIITLFIYMLLLQREHVRKT